MLIIQHSVTTTGSAQALWALYADPATWPLWDEGIEYANLDGSFAARTRGELKPQGGPEIFFLITYMKENVYFSDTSFLPLTELIFTHILKPEGGTLTFTHCVEMKGLLAPLFALVVGRKIKKGLPDAMRALAHMAERTP